MCGSICSGLRVDLAQSRGQYTAGASNPADGLVSPADGLLSQVSLFVSLSLSLSVSLCLLSVSSLSLSLSLSLCLSVSLSLSFQGLGLAVPLGCTHQWIGRGEGVVRTALQGLTASASKSGAGDTASFFFFFFLRHEAQVPDIGGSSSVLAQGGMSKKPT